MSDVIIKSEDLIEYEDFNNSSDFEPIKYEQSNPSESVSRFSPLETFHVPISFDNHPVSFVMSNVGHPMLAVNQYTFHKHSTNQKTGRINWRCSKRRVKDINCPSSCYTVDGIVSNPTTHTLKCVPVSQNILNSYQHKRSNMQNISFINTKAESYTTLKNKQSDEFNECIDFDEPHTFEDFEDPNNTQIFEQSFCQPRLYVDEHLRKQKLIQIPNDSNFVCTVEESVYDELEFTDPSDSGLNLIPNREQNKNYRSETRRSSTSEVNELSQSPKSFTDLLGQMNHLKNKEVRCAYELKRAYKEINKIKKSSALQIQALKWKATIMEIDMNSMEQMISQRTMENSGLKNMCDEMLSKLKPKDFC